MARTSARLSLAATLALCASAQVVLPKDYVDNDHHAEPLPFIHSSAAGGAEQLWVAYGATPDAITISWLSSAAGAQSLVRYDTTPGTFAHSATGSAKPYTCGSYTSGDIHQVALTGLPLATRIYYKVGDDSTQVRESSSSARQSAHPLTPRQHSRPSPVAPRASAPSSPRRA
jgi:hypothetical protein